VCDFNLDSICLPSALPMPVTTDIPLSYSSSVPVSTVSPINETPGSSPSCASQELISTVSMIEPSPPSNTVGSTPSHVSHGLINAVSTPVLHMLESTVSVIPGLTPTRILII